MSISAVAEDRRLPRSLTPATRRPPTRHPDESTVLPMRKPAQVRPRASGEGIPSGRYGPWTEWSRLLNRHPHSRHSGLGVRAQPVEIEQIALGVQPRQRAREPVVDHAEKRRPASPFHRGSRPLFFRRRSGGASARAPGSADAVQPCRALRRFSRVPLRCARSNATTPPRSWRSRTAGSTARVPGVQPPASRGVC